MRDVSIIGIGQVEVGEHWDKSLRELGYYALSAAMRDAKVGHIDSLYVGNMLSGELTGQEHIGAIIADFAGLRGVEAVGIEAACGHGPYEDATIVVLAEDSAHVAGEHCPLHREIIIYQESDAISSFQQANINLPIAVPGQRINCATRYWA